MDDVNVLPDQAAYESCDFTNAERLADAVDSPFVLQLESAGTLFFSDSTGMHCQAGQKVQVVVTDSRVDWPARECSLVVDNDLTVDHVAHAAGYMNLTGFLGIADYADAEVHHCGGNSVTLNAAMAGMPTADENGNYRMNNDALLMEGYLCHVCLPEPCANGGVCSHIPWGFTCDCSGTGFGGDTCERQLTPEPCAPAFGRAATSSVMATGAHGLAHPRDLQFHPLNTNELWVANNDTDSITIIDTVAGTAVTRRDRAPYHYMERISSLAFDSRGYFATCQESENSYDEMMIPNWFMGPTLFHSDPAELVNQLGEPGCDTTDPDRTCFFTHWDMLHESPLCMGITHDPETETPFGNVYWAFDGLNSSLIRYDFQEPHGPGSLDHSIAAIRRYPEIELTRVPGVPGHLMMDPTERVLYIADTGGGRILRMDPDSGHFIRTAKREFPIYSSIAETFEYSIYGCTDWEVFVDGLDNPSGMHVDGSHVYVGEWGSSTIIAFDKSTRQEVSRISTGASGLNGFAMDASGQFWFSDGPSNTVAKVTVEVPCADTAPATSARVDWPVRECSLVVDNDLTVDHVAHAAGYMNLTGFLGVADYADAEVHHCGGNSVTLNAAMAGMPTADENGNYRMNNDALLMEGYLCHVCLPEPCANGGVCSHIPWGFTCDCSGTGFGGDTCERQLTPEPCAPAFGRAATSSVMATGAHGLAHPRDLQFHPLRTNELWVANNDTDSITIIDTVAGTAVTRRDRAPYHYMERISSLAFDSRGYFATCQESENSYDEMMIPNWFMGPTLFHSDPEELINQLGEPGCDTSDPEDVLLHTLGHASREPSVYGHY